MPFKEPDTDELLARAVEAGTLRLSDRAADAAAGRRDRAHARHAVVLAHRDRHVATSAPCSTTLLPHLREGHLLVLRSTVAPGTTEFVAGYLEKHRGFTRRARTSSSPTCPSGSPPTASWPRSGRCRASSAASARRSGERAARAVRAARRADRPDHAGPGRAGQDLGEHPALRDVRAAEPADDGLRALRRERVRGHRPDQPRLPARRDRAAAASPPARACARTSRSARSARNAPGMLLAVSRVNETRAAVPRRGDQAPARRPARAQGRRARARVQGRHRRRARLALAQADPPARARAGRRRRPRPGRGDADGRLRRGRDRRRRRRRGHEPRRVLDARGARGDRAHGRAGLPRRRPLERVRRRPGVRLRERGRRVEPAR